MAETENGWRNDAEAAMEPRRPGVEVSTLDRAATLPGVVPGIALWTYPLGRVAGEVAALSRLLSPDERTRAARFGTDALRQRWIAGRGQLRLLLAAALGLDAATLRLRRSPRGRPSLAEVEGIDFNIAHTQDVAVAAISRIGRIGIDLERRDRVIDADKVARRVLHPEERTDMATLDPAARRERFLRVWTCKEALSKATGDGLAAPFRSIRIRLEGEALRVASGPGAYAPDRWRLFDVAAGGPFLCTLALAQGRPGEGPGEGMTAA